MDCVITSIFLARAGFNHISSYCLPWLARIAADEGFDYLLKQVNDDPGMCIIRSIDLPSSLFTLFRK